MPRFTDHCLRPLCRGGERREVSKGWGILTLERRRRRKLPRELGSPSDGKKESAQPVDENAKLHISGINC